MRKPIILFILIAALPQALRAQQPTPGTTAGPIVADRVIAVVGDTVLLQSDVTVELLRLQAAGQLPDGNAARDSLGRQIMSRKVDNLVMLEAAEAAGVTVPDEQINQMVDDQIARVRAQFSSDAEFSAALARESPPMTLSQYRQDLTDQIRADQTIQSFLAQRLGNRARPLIDESEIEAYFEERRQSMGERPATASFEQVIIAPTPSDEARDSARAQAEDILQQLQDGADFEVLARRFSDDPGTAEYGGDLGWFRPGRMVPEFEQAAYSLRPGQTSGIVETQFGYHIIRLDRVRGAERQARHILIQPEVTEADITIARERADSVAQAARSGTDILDLAEQYNSEDVDPTTARAALDRLPPGYADALASSSPGDILGPIEIDNPQATIPACATVDVCFAILRVTERNPAGPYLLDDVRDQIRQQLQQNQMVDGLLTELKQQIYVDVQV